VFLSAEALDGILDSLRRDGDYMRGRAERQAEARQGWVEGLSFKPASIQQAERPPLTLGQRVKESIDKACATCPSLSAQTDCVCNVDNFFKTNQTPMKVASECTSHAEMPQL
jgi:hypothetical protein